MRIGILGPLTVELDHRRLEVTGGRLKALLARLAIDVGQPVSTTSLADAIWDGELPADELHALQSLVSRLRRALVDGDLVEQSAGGYRLARLSRMSTRRDSLDWPRTARSRCGVAIRSAPATC